MSNVVRAGAAYEAVLRDNVTGKVDRIIAGLNELGKEFNQLVNPANKAGKAMDRVGGAAANAGKRVSQQLNVMKAMRNTFSSLTSVMSTASQAIGQSLIHIGNQMRNAGLAATAAAAAIGAAFTKSIQASARYEAAITGLRQVFKDSADENLAWADSFSETLGRSPTETIEGLRAFRAVLSSLDLPAAQLDKMARAMQSLSVDLAAAAEISDQQAITKMMQGLSGSAIDELRKLGITVSDAFVKEFAKGLGIATKELTEQQKMVIRYNLIVKQMKEGLNAVGQAMREKDSFPNQMKRLRGEIERTAIKIGQHFMPIATKLLGIFRNLAEAIRQVPMERLEQLAGVMIGLGAAGVVLVGLGMAVAALGPPIIALGTVIASLTATLAGLMAAFAAAPAATAITTAILGLTAALTALGIKGRVTLLPFRDYLKQVTQAFGSLSDIATQAIDGIARKLDEGDFQGAWDIFVVAGKLAFWTLAETFKVIFRDALEEVIEGIKEQFQQVTDWMQGNLSRRRFENPNRPEVDEAEERRKAVEENPRIKELQELLDKLTRVDEPFGVGSAAMIATIGVAEAAADNAARSAEEAARAIRGTSIGGFGAGFARDMGMFGPSSTFVDNQEKQLDEAEKQTRAQQNMEQILNNMEPLTMGN